MIPCQLQANELPLRHLMKQLFGQTTGPAAFSGPTGSALQDYEQLIVGKYDARASGPSLPELLNDFDLSTDQNNLYQISQTIISGLCPEELATRNPEKMAHSRWLTTANRTQRLYVQQRIRHKR